MGVDETKFGATEVDEFEVNFRLWLRNCSTENGYGEWLRRMSYYVEQQCCVALSEATAFSLPLSELQYYPYTVLTENYMLFFKCFQNMLVFKMIWGTACSPITIRVAIFAHCHLTPSARQSDRRR